MKWKNFSLKMKFSLAFGAILLLLLIVGGRSVDGISNILNTAQDTIDGNQLRGEMLQREIDHLKWAEAVGDFIYDEEVAEMNVQTDPRECGFGKWYYGEGRKQAVALYPELKAPLDSVEDPHARLHQSAISIKENFTPFDTDLLQFIAEKETDHLKWVNSVLMALTQKKDHLDAKTDHRQCSLGRFLYGEDGQRIADSDPELRRLLDEILDPHQRLHQSAILIEKELSDPAKAFRLFESETLPALAQVQEIFKGINERSIEILNKQEKAEQIYTSETVPNLNQVQAILREIIDKTSAQVKSKNAELLSESKSTRSQTIIFSVLALLTGIALAILFSRQMVVPLRRTSEMIQKMEEGNLSGRLNISGQDEIGCMAQAMDQFADNLQQEVLGNLKKMAAGDLTFDVHPRSDQDELRNALKAVRSDLHVLIRQVQAAGEQIASGSVQVADSSQSLSQGATEQASSLEEISASMAEISSQTRNNAENAAEAHQFASRTKDSAMDGNTKMQQMVSAMSEINEAGKNIGRIIKTIDEIAFQTNLLALNAAVEAARAGQHGKGFAVVAEEVRNLAARSAKAARETAELIEGTIQKTENGAIIAHETQEALGEIVAGIAQVSGLVEKISTANNEQAHGIGEVNTGLGQIDQVTQQNTASAEECAAAAEELSGQASELQLLLERFRLEKTVSGSTDSSLSKPRPKQFTNQNPKIQLPKIVGLNDDDFGRYS